MESKKPEGPTKRNPREEAERQLKNIKVGSQISFEGTIYTVEEITKGKEYVLKPADPNKETETVPEETLKEELENGNAVLVSVGETSGRWTREDQQELERLEAEAERDGETIKTPEIKVFSQVYIKKRFISFLESQKNTVKIIGLNVEGNDDVIKLTAEVLIKDDFRAKKESYTWFLRATLLNNEDTVMLSGNVTTEQAQSFVEQMKEYIRSRDRREIEKMKIENGALEVSFGAMISVSSGQIEQTVERTDEREPKEPAPEPIAVERVKNPDMRTFSPDYIKQIVSNLIVNDKSTIKINSLKAEGNDDRIKLTGKIQAKDDYRSRKGDYNKAFIWTLQAELFNDGDTVAISGTDSIAGRHRMMEEIKEHISKEERREIKNMKIEKGVLEVTFE